MGQVDGSPTCGKPLPPAAQGHPDGPTGTLVALVRPAGQARVGEGVDDAMGAGGLDVVDGARQGRRGPQQSAMGIGDDLHVHTVLLVLPGVERAVGGDLVDRQQRPVGDHERLACRRLHCGSQFRGECDQNVDGLGDVPVGGGGADTEAGCELGIGVPAPQVGQCQQGLVVGAQTPPAGAASPAVGPQLSRQKAQGGAGHVDPSRIDKHVKPLVEMVLLVENSSTRGFTPLSAQLAITITRLEKAH